MPAGTGVWVVKTVRRPDGLERVVEGEAVVAHELADALDAEEAGVALVGVVDLRRGGAR